MAPPPLRPVATVSETAADIALKSAERRDDYLGPDGKGFYTSTKPEYWCADFVKWCWAGAKAYVDDELTPAAESFYNYGETHGTLHTNSDYQPQIGDAVVFHRHEDPKGVLDPADKKTYMADHVAIVTGVDPDTGNITTVSGDWDGVDPTGVDEAAFATSAHVIENRPYQGKVGSYAGPMGGEISAFVTPVAPDPGLCLATAPDHGVRAGKNKQLVAVAHPACLHSGGQPVVTGSNSIFVGEEQAPLAGQGDLTEDGYAIHDRTDDKIYMA